MPSKKFPRHRVERTRNKHSRALFRNGTIVIRLARGLSPLQEREHVSDLLGRMKNQVLEEQRKTLINPFGRLLDGGESVTVILASGRKYRFTLRPSTTTSVRSIGPGNILVSVAPSVRRRRLHALLWKSIASMEQHRMETLIRAINEQTFGVWCSGFRFRFASSQWGSCSPKGVIMLNAALLFVEPEVLRYVIIHELAHRKRSDHSARYWAWVGWAMPQFTQAREKLQSYRLPTF